MLYFHGVYFGVVGGIYLNMVNTILARAKSNSVYKGNIYITTTYKQTNNFKVLISK